MAELKGFSGSGHTFQGKRSDLGRTYQEDRKKSVAPVRETGATQVAPWQEIRATWSHLFNIFVRLGSHKKGKQVRPSP